MKSRFRKIVACAGIMSMMLTSVAWADEADVVIIEDDVVTVETVEADVEAEEIVDNKEVLDEDVQVVPEEGAIFDEVVDAENIIEEAVEVVSETELAALEDGAVAEEAFEPTVVTEDGVSEVDIREFMATTSSVQKGFQAAFDYAKSVGGLVIKVPAGDYCLEGTAYIFSNTTLKLDANARIYRAAGNTSTMISNGPDDKSQGWLESSLGGYDRSHDITIDGGIWDFTKNGGGTSESDFTNCIYFGHAKNVTIKNAVIKNCVNVHLIEITGCKNVVIDNVNIGGFTTVGSVEEAEWKEAIQLDYVTADTSSFFKPYDKTPCDNVTIQNCTIHDYPCAVGQHTDMGNIYHNGVRIINNTFKNISNREIDFLRFKNFAVTGNTIDMTGMTEHLPIYVCDGVGDISGNTIKGKATNAIDIYEKSNVTITDNNIESAKYIGIHVKEGSYGDVRSNTVKNCGDTGIKFSVGATGVIQSNSISDCKISNVNITDAKADVVANTLVNSESAGISLINTTGAMKISGNTITNSKVYPIITMGNSDITIDLNEISKFSEYGIYVRESQDGTKRSKNVSIVENKISNGGLTGIGVRNADNTIVNGNVVSGTSVNGIYIANTCKNSKVANNKGNLENYDSTSTADVGGWFKNSNGKWSYKYNGQMLKGWQTLEGKTYYFDNDGYLYTGWVKKDNAWYYFDTNGMATSRWISGLYYVKADGKMAVSEWVDSGKYYVDGNGKWVKNPGSSSSSTSGTSTKKAGWQKDKTGWWYQNANGTYPSNCWAKIDGKWYHFNKSGYMQTGWLKDGKSWYFLTGSGAMATGWLKNGGKWYFMGTDGAMKTGWIRDGGKDYYMYSDGHMAANEWIGKYHVNSSGVWDKTK